MSEHATPGGRGPPTPDGTDERRGFPTPDEWQLLEPLIDTVLDAAPEQRLALIAQLSGGNAARRTELERLLAECDRAFPQIEGRATDRFAAVLGDETPSIPELLAERYEVVREVGRGGMAIVYLARDLKYGRDVAVKVVRPDLTASIRRVRFLHEIEIAARLRHPHIVPLYDSGEVPADAEPGETGAPLLYYVMPYEPGHSLRERLEHNGPLSADDTLLVLRDLCEALAHAHQHGIVHRDIKPDNVLLSGRHALVTDFGVARAVTESTTDSAAGGTGTTALGTPAYMAPEQTVPGARVDHRADIYAVGVLGYELLIGRPPFAGSESNVHSSADVSGAIRELARLRPDVPAALLGSIATCLAPRPEERWQSADELHAQLAKIPATAAGSGATPGLRRAKRLALAGAALAGLIVALVIALAIARSRSRSMPTLIRLGRANQITSELGLEVQPSIAPDGQHIAYAVGNSLRMRIAVRPVAGGHPRWLTADTANAWFPQWSRDGSRILFLSRGGVFSAPASGGAAREEVAARADAIVLSATWSANGREIAYVRQDSLFARVVGARDTRLVATGSDLHSCRWSPDGAWLACVSGNSFYVTAGAVSGVGPMFDNLAPSRIVLVPAAGGHPVSVTNGASLHQSPVWSPDGSTLYYVSSEDGPRDVYALDVRARTATEREPVRITTGMGAQSIDFSADGTRMVYAAYSSIANVWAMPIPTHPPTSAAPVGASGSAVEVTSGNQTAEGVRISLDKRWLIYDSNLSGNSDVYRIPVTGGEPEQLTHAPSDEFRGTLSPDGRELAYHSFQTGTRNIFMRTLGDSSVRQLTRTSGQLSMANWSPDGTALTFFDLATADVMVMRRDAHGRWSPPHIVARHGWRPEWSPDGGTVAFISPSDGGIGAVAVESGARRSLYQPQGDDPLAELALYSANGRELYFKSHDAHGRASFWSIPAIGGRPHLLVRFDDPAWSSNRFDFASDGRRFYFTVEDRQSDIWAADVTRR